jgi:hypothetical protein
MKLVMTLRTRDQADVVRALIDYHLHAGVDFIVATDHRSRDGTVEILREYARAGVLYLTEEHGAEVRGQEWRTRMARMAATELGADWVFSCDGDEFWWPRAASLKHALVATPPEFGVVHGLVRHFVPVAEADGAFWERMIVRYAPAAAVNSPLSPFRPYSKVAHRADPMVVVHRGNHELHRTCHRVLPGWSPLEVLHFPIRSAEQAKRKYLTWAHVLGADAKGTHVTTSRAARAGATDEHVATYFASDEMVRRGLRIGVLQTDVRLRDTLRGLLAEPRVSPSAPAQVPSPLADLEAALDARVVRSRRRLDQLSRRVQAHERRMTG